MVCYFGHNYNAWDEFARHCPFCYSAYKKFCKNMPAGWRAVMGDSATILGLSPEFHEWEEEQRIKKQLQDGRISQAEAARQVQDLKARLQKRYCPTKEDILERRRIAAAREAARQKTIFDAPSLL